MKESHRVHHLELFRWWGASGRWASAQMSAFTGHRWYFIVVLALGLGEVLSQLSLTLYFEKFAC